MSVSQTVTSILDEVTLKTGTPVEVIEDSKLHVLANISFARPGVPFHILRVNPNQGNPDYLIAFQCGFVLRQAALTDDEKWQFGPAPEAIQSVSRLLNGPGGLASKMGLPKKDVETFAQQIAVGLLTQLRSMPLGIRIDRWITTSFPDLAELQNASLRKQVAENAGSLSPSIRQVTPTTVWKANVTMNATFATIASELLHDDSILLPYEATGFLNEAEQLLKALDEITSEPAGDKALILRWAELLGISDWVTFHGVLA